MTEPLRLSSQQTGSEEHKDASVIAPANSLAAMTATTTPMEDAPHIDPANKPRTLNAVLAQITEHEADLRRDRFPASQIRVESDRLIAGDQEFHLNSEGLHRLCKRFQAPASYLNRLSPNSAPAFSRNISRKASLPTIN